MTDDDLRTLAPTFQAHSCMPFCATPCDIKGYRVWHHQERVRYTPAELAERQRVMVERIAEMREKGVLP